jgi:alginate O-acetyltransferase complex protein AlgI
VIALSTLIIVAALAAVPLAWLMPNGRGIDAVAWLGLVVLVVISPPSAAWMALATVLAPLVMQLAERLNQRGAFAALWTLVLVTAFVAAQLTPGWIWIGGAFFTLRQIHVIGDWWMGKLAPPTLAANLRYQLFLPALFIGPVHRIQNFEREYTRRR